MNFKRVGGILLALGLALALFTALKWTHGDTRIASMGGITALMATLWITEAVPLGATSLLPIVLFPLTGIADVKMVTPLYAHHIIFLFIAGFLLAFAMEKWNLHRRIAFKIIGLIGFSPVRILAGFMIASFVLSMWISNLATTILLLAPALAVINEFKQSGMKSPKFGVGLLLGIAYISSVGGTTTPIGTAPNLIFMSLWEEHFTHISTVGFLDWMSLGVPIGLVLGVLTFLLVKRMFIRKDENIESEGMKARIRELPKIGIEEIVILVFFFALLILWFTRRDLELGGHEFRGWSTRGLWENPGYIRDSAIGMGIVLLLFFIPSSKKNEHILEWTDAKKLPFDILFIFGGGFALAYGFKQSGLDQLIAGQLTPLADLPLWLMVLGICVFMTFLTEITSNTATTQLVLPLLVIMAQSTQINPVYLMVPATFSASFAFMLPVATPPNAIVFGTELIPLKEMMRTGLWLNLLGIIVMTLMTILLAEILT